MMYVVGMTGPGLRWKWTGGKVLAKLGTNWMRQDNKHRLQGSKSGQGLCTIKQAGHYPTLETSFTQPLY